MKSISGFLLLLIAFNSINAQIAVNEIPSNPVDAVNVFSQKKDSFTKKNIVQLKSFIIPVALVTYGAITMSNHSATSLNGKIQKSIWIDKPHSSKHYDNYLMFLPAASVYALNALGVKGKNNFRDRTMIYLLSNSIAGAIIYPTKSLTSQLRPDSTNYNSFPSGHTALSFASAEFMRMEYKDVSPWYAVAGYAMATATGYLRLYNNKHWFSDVVAGAGIGIASTKLAYWLYPKIQMLFFKEKKDNTIVVPTYQNGVFGISLTHNLK